MIKKISDIKQEIERVKQENIVIGQEANRLHREIKQFELDIATKKGYTSYSEYLKKEKPLLYAEWLKWQYNP